MKSESNKSKELDELIKKINEDKKKKEQENENLKKEIENRKN